MRSKLNLKHLGVYDGNGGVFTGEVIQPMLKKPHTNEETPQTKPIETQLEEGTAVDETRDTGHLLAAQESLDIEEAKFDFGETKLEIVEEAVVPLADKEKHLVTFSLPSFPARQRSSAAAHETSPGMQQPKAGTPRKPAFNPLHVILKDKNKYYTTEYI